MAKFVNAISRCEKGAYLKAIQDSCDYIKNNLAEKMLSDFDENKISKISFTIDVELGEVSIVKIEKEYLVEGED